MGVVEISYIAKRVVHFELWKSTKLVRVRSRNIKSFTGFSQCSGGVLITFEETTGKIEKRVH